MICVVIGRTRHKMMQAEIQEAAKHGAELIELRLDFLAKAPDFQRLLANKPCPLVATCRRPEDGGRWSGTEEARQVLLRQAIVAGFDWVDLETDIADRVPRYKDVKRIVSYHNFKEVPADLKQIHQAMCKQDADVVKLAVRAQQPADNLRVLELLQAPSRPTVAFCMGDLGIPSRILNALYRVPFGYGAFNKERGVAPGQPSYDELKNVYHFDQLTPETKVFGVIGDPVGHSLSPLVHNAALHKLGMNAVYLPFRVPRGELANFVKEFERIPVHGYSVTIPHKEAAAEAAVKKHASVTLTQAANTLVRNEEGFIAYNTDYYAILDSLRHNLLAPDGTPLSLRSRSVLILGAGGVARAAAHALHREGAIVTIANRTAERARNLAREVGCRHTDWSARFWVNCDLLINCTSVGMHPNVDETPIHQTFLKPGLTVFDTVYTPETTLLIKEARGRGCRTLTGVDLFVRQAALQFRLFTGREPPIDLMMSTVRRALSPVALQDQQV